MKNARLKWILAQWERLHWLIPLLLLFTIISNAATIAYPLLFRKLMDLLSGILAKPGEHPDPMQQVNRLLWLFLAIGLGQFVAGFYPLVRGVINNLFEHRLRMRYFKDLQEKDYAFFQHFRTGDLVTRLNDNNSSFVLCSGIFRSLDMILMLLFGIGVMLSIHVRLTLLSLAPIPFILFLLYKTISLLQTGSRKNLEAISNINNQLEMSFSGIRIIKSFVSEAKYTRFFNDALDSRIKTELSLVRLQSIQHLLFEYLNYFAQIGVIIFGGWLAVKGEISIGTFFLFYTYLAIMITPMISLPNLFVVIKQANVSINRLEEIKNYPVSSPATKGEHKLGSFASLCFKDVSFRYPEKEKGVLKSCSFTLQKGEKMLILGATGSGKSTLINLLSGILQPESGEIMLNGISFDKVELASWRELLGFVPQETQLFSGTVKQNIYFTADEADEKSYGQAVKTAQLQEELLSFPEGDATTVGSKGQTVSGGQKQRITIARALLKKPQLLILDDITASLDSDNEERLWQALKQNYGDITCIAISQRLSTLRFTDRVLFIDSEGYCHFDGHDRLVVGLPEYAEFLAKG
jgi:ATP-binding cassette subfamily B protein